MKSISIIISLLVILLVILLVLTSCDKGSVSSDLSSIDSTSISSDDVSSENISSTVSSTVSSESTSVNVSSTVTSNTSSTTNTDNRKVLYGGTQLKQGCYFSESNAIYPVGGVLPTTVKRGTVYEEGDYRYIRDWDAGWRVEVKDKYKTSYEEMYVELLGEPVVNLDHTFDSCQYLVTSPKIPDTVTSMEETFFGCVKLTTAPKLPNNITYLNRTFAYCRSLTTMPELPLKIEMLGGTFVGSGITKVPDLSKYTKLYYISDAFQNCENLTTVECIPATIKTMNYAFFASRNIQGTLIFNANPSAYDGCFSSGDNPVEVIGTSNMMAEVFEKYENFTFDSVD